MIMDPKMKTEMRNREAQRVNPCYMEQQLSLQCLDKNNYDRESCQLYFENVKSCKKFWGNVAWGRRFRGVKPAMPDFEEREQIKEELKRMRKGYD